MSEHPKKLYLSRTDKKISGVCAGLAKYFNIDPTIVRLIFVVAGFHIWGIFLYIIMAIIVPEEPTTHHSPPSESHTTHIA